MKNAGVWLSGAMLAFVIIVGGLYLRHAWTSLDGVMLTTHGWIALSLGVVFSILVGGALAALLIISRRHGYDEAAAEETSRRPPFNDEDED